MTELLSNKGFIIFGFIIIDVLLFLCVIYADSKLCSSRLQRQKNKYMKEQNVNDINEKYLQKERESYELRMDYENELLKEYGIRSISKPVHLDILCIADLHGRYTFSKKEIELLCSEFDVCFLLGDNSKDSIGELLNYVPKEKVFGILGNHDSFDTLEAFDIENIHGKIITLNNNVKVAGLQGSFKYKNVDYPAYTQEESLDIADAFNEPIDVLISHEGPWLRKSFTCSHCGLKGITKLMYKQRIAHNIHGHLHSYSAEKLNNESLSVGLYGIQKIRILNNRVIIDNILDETRGHNNGD